MIWALVYVIGSAALAAWEISRSKGLYRHIANPGPRKPTVELPPAPRLVINLPQKTEHPPAS